jgi:hypothetical protein
VQPAKHGKTERLAGSEVAGGSVVLTKDPMRPGRWKAKMHLPRLAWQKYSYRDPGVMLGQRIEDLLEGHLPEVDVVGPVRRGEKQLVLHNATKEKLTVHLQRRTRTRSGADFSWVWLPGEPKASKSFRLKLDPGQNVKVTNALIGARSDRDDDPEFSASRVRVWAESEAGDRWLDHRDDDLWLVEKNPKLGNQHVYYAEQVGTYTYTFRPRPGPRIYTERVVNLRNATASKMTVQLDYLSIHDGKQRWRSVPDFVIPPKSTVHVREADQSLVRAQAIKFKAISTEAVYQAHWVTPLWIVEAVAGTRAYRAPVIGSYVHTLQPLNVDAP